MVGGGGEFDPQDGDLMTPVIPSIIGWEWYPEMRSKSGTLHTSEYIKVESIPGNGYDRFSLKGDDRFIFPDYVFIHFKPKISLSQPVFTYLNLYNGIREITGSETMDSTYYRKLCEIVTGGPSPTIQLLNIANVPDLTLLVFSTVRGSQKQATIKAAGTEVIFCSNGTFPAIFLGQGEVVWLIRQDNGWHVANQWDGMAKVGIQTNMDIVRPNTILFNGGGLVDSGGNPVGLLRGLYPRAEWYVLTQLSAGQLLPKETRDAGGLELSGFWAIDDTFIWAPDYRGHSRRALPGTRGNDANRDNNSLPGSYEADEVKEHNHLPDDPTLNKLVRSVADTAGQFSAAVFTGVIHDDRLAMNHTAALKAYGGGETRGKNNGVLMGCYI